MTLEELADYLNDCVRIKHGSPALHKDAVNLLQPKRQLKHRALRKHVLSLIERLTQ